MTDFGCLGPLASLLSAILVLTDLPVSVALTWTASQVPVSYKSHMA